MTEWPLWSGGTPAEPEPAHPSAPVPPAAPAPTCPSCGRPIDPAALFCEACGNPLVPTAAAAPATAPTGDSSTQTRRLGERASALADCPVCGGSVGADGYCQTCGAKAPSARDHFTSAPAPWVGGVCDRGVQHSRNEDAMALWAQGDRAVLVVCDGVSSSIDSDVAALAGAEKARDVLVTLNSDGIGGDESEDTAVASSLVAATEEANKAVIAHTAPESTNAASATFAAAVVLNDRVHYANLGDSRVYLLTPSEKVLLTLDDSMAQAFISEGMPRAEAESLPRAHAITKWLGRDAIDTVPRTGHHAVTEPGWLVVCSDGLWNYASSPEELSAQVDAAAAVAGDPVGIAGRLVVWANTQGGKDNVTVALARVPAGAPSLGATPRDQQKESVEHG
ncbi:MAG TPA: protein phosphatase 2C domain-containing protein [Propionicimonas sp.]|uniref:protein phosphatase 2C domain-containing protein n=1 Tax=Propionicimonas sp. TaxID=1955623 RepID=UPI002F4062D1